MYNGFPERCGPGRPELLLRQPPAEPWRRADLRDAASRSGRSGSQCACCPPNVMRLISSLSHYVATQDAGGVQVHQYAGADIGFETGGAGRALLRMETDYPWKGPREVRGGGDRRRSLEVSA